MLFYRFQATNLYNFRVMKLKPRGYRKKKTGDEVQSDMPAASASFSWRQWLPTIFILAAALVLAFTLKAFVIQPYMVDGQSMETTLQDHDRLLVDKLPQTFAHLSGHSYIPNRGDIIVFNQANLPGYSGPKQLIKRVIGLPGDRVVIKDSQITVFNHNDPKGFNPDTSGDYVIEAPSTTGNTDITLTASQIFVCGDNRANSEDSRFFGPIKSSSIVGKLVLRIFPLSSAERF